MGGEAHHGKKRGNFVQRTIDSLAEAMERSLYAEQLASSRGILQTLDPRTKLIGTFLPDCHCRLSPHHSSGHRAGGGGVWVSAHIAHFIAYFESDLDWDVCF
jgi:hypothetical protein